MNPTKQGTEQGGGAALRCPRCGAAMAPEAVREERRRHPRVEHRTMVRIDGRAAMLFDVSLGGLKLSSPFAPPAGMVEVEVEAGAESFLLKGKVRWVGGKRSFSNLLDFGVEIVDPPRAYLELVERLLPPGQERPPLSR